MTQWQFGRGGSIPQLHQLLVFEHLLQVFFCDFMANRCDFYNILYKIFEQGRIEEIVVIITL